MINAYVVKKWSALGLAIFIPTMLFTIGNLIKGVIWGVVLFFCGLLLSFVAGNLLLRNPFTNMLEGKGLLAVNMDSTGIVPFFNIRLENPKIVGRFMKQNIDDTFDRDAVFNFVPPGKRDGLAVQTEDGGLLIKINNKEYNKGRFASLHYPMVIWNDQMKSLVTKDFFSEQEKHSFAEHQALHLNQQMNSLTSITRDFARYVVNQLKPGTGFLAEHKGTIIVIILFVIVGGALLAIFWPAIKEAFLGGGAGGAISTAKGAMSELQTIRPT